MIEDIEYNTERSKLIIPEYGRHIQKMVDQAVATEDRVERNKIAARLMQNKFITSVAKTLLPNQVSEIIVRKILGKSIIKPDILEKDKRFLEKMYQDDVLKLQKIISRKIPWKWDFYEI